MLTLKTSPSALVTLDSCEMKYYISEVLGYRGSATIPMALGTTLHKLMEILAKAKKLHQDTKESKILVEDETIGKYEFNVNKWNQLKKIEFGEKEYNIYSLDEVKDIYNLVYTYYSNFHSEQNWDIEEKQKIEQWFYICLTEKDYKYDPRKRIVVQPEQRLSYTIPEEWAAYDYGDGVIGQWKLNGVIDIIYKNEDESYDIVDYKSGSRKDFATGKMKDANSLRNDIQLMAYYYLINKLYPEFQNVNVTIFFVKDGGPFIPFFCPDDIPRIEQRLKEYYNRISSCKSPVQIDSKQRDFKCRKFCDFSSKFSLDGKCLCAAVADRIKKDGIDKVTHALRQK